MEINSNRDRKEQLINMYLQLMKRGQLYCTYESSHHLLDSTLNIHIREKFREHYLIYYTVCLIMIKYSLEKLLLEETCVMQNKNGLF